MPTEGGNFPQLTANKETGTSVVQLQGTEFCHQPPRQACVWEGGEARAGCCEALEGMSESGGGGVAEELLRRRASGPAGWLSVLPWSVPRGSLGSLQI